MRVQSSHHKCFLTFKRILLPLCVLMFSAFSQNALAIFQVRFLGGTLNETSSSQNQKGTLFKTLISFGGNLRFTSSFAYSQSSYGKINILQGEVGFGATYYPHFSEPVPFFLPYLHLEGVGLFATEDDTSTTNPKEQKYSGAANIGVGMDINFSRTFGLTLGMEVHNSKQHRILIGFLQGY